MATYNVHNYYTALAAPSPGQVTAGPSYIPTVLGLAVQNATADEKNQFQILQHQHIQHLIQTGKVVYYLPRGMGIRMGLLVLHGIADKLSLLVATDVFVHFDINQLVYRIGQVSDQQDANDTAGLSMVYCAQFIAPIPISHPATTQTGSSPPAHAEKIPKPRNKWILYRQSKHREIVEQNPGMHTSQISKIIGQMWRLELPSVIFHFERLAEAEKAAHLLKYPGYRARNRRPAEIKRRNKHSTSIAVKKATRASKQQTAAQLNSAIKQGYKESTANDLNLSSFETVQSNSEKMLVDFNTEYDNTLAEMDKAYTAIDDFVEKQWTAYPEGAEFAFNFDDYLNYD